jgi:hypothetical protein
VTTCADSSLVPVDFGKPGRAYPQGAYPQGQGANAARQLISIVGGTDDLPVRSWRQLAATLPADFVGTLLELLCRERSPFGLQCDRELDRDRVEIVAGDLPL